MWSQGKIRGISDTKNLSTDNTDAEHALSLELSLKAQFELKHVLIENSPSDNLLHFNSNHVSLVSYASFQFYENIYYHMW